MPVHAPLAAPVRQEWTFSDGYRAAGRVWPPATGDRLPPIIYLHGIQSHGGWYEWSGSFLAAAGHPVVMPDRRGSGWNADQRGDVRSYRRWLADLDELVQWVEREFGCPQVGLVGVSWGGKLALVWALDAQRAARLQGLLLIAPGIVPAVDIGWRGRVRVAWSMLSDPARPVAIPLDDASLFTDHPAAREFIRRDPLKLTHVTARFLLESGKLDACLVRAPSGSLRVPATLILAGRDRIIRNEATALRLRRIAGAGLTIHRVGPAAHTLEFEADVDPLERCLRAWSRSLGAGPSDASTPPE